MTDPLRLSEDADADLALLLRAGQKEVPPRRALEKTIAGLGVATTVIGASHAAAAAVTAGKLGIWTLVKWAGGGILGGVITIGGVELVQHGARSNGRQPVSVTAPASAVVERETGAPRGAGALATRPVVPAVESAPVVPPPSQSAKVQSLVTGERRAGASGTPANGRAGALPARASQPLAPELDSAITLEIRLIDEARGALRTGRPASALEVLSRYRTEVTRQRLAPEARYLEMEALLAAGNGAAARKSASALLERYPKGPHTARARAILEAGAESP